MEYIKKRVKLQKGFTLVEIIVVLVVLAILAAFTIPTMLGFVADAKGKAYIAEAREVYVAAQAVTTEYSGTTNLMDGNNPSLGTTVNGDAHSNGIGVSISSFEVQHRHQYYPTPDKYLPGHEPQMNASNQMYRYVSPDIPSISPINLLNDSTLRPTGQQAAWIVTVGVGDDNVNGKGATGTQRTGKVTKVVYYRNGYQVTIEGNNASVEKY